MVSGFFVKRACCPACESPGRKRLYACSFLDSPVREYLRDFYSRDGVVEFEYLEGATYILDECATCGLVYQEEVPNDDLLERLYEKWIDPKRAFRRHLENDGLDYHRRCAQDVMKLVAYFGRAPSDLDFFDFGMGWGKWARMAQAFGCNVQGTELSRSRIEYVRTHGIDIVTMAEAQKLRFDFVNMEHVMEHIPDPLDTLCTLGRSLKPNGLVRIWVPDGGDIRRRLKVMDWTAPKGSRNSLNVVSPLEHLNCFSRSSLIYMAAKAGLVPTGLPLGIEYAYGLCLRSPRSFIKTIALPVYRNFLRRGTCLFFRLGH
jgi:SAM-dependent methyltransferase